MRVWIDLSNSPHPLLFEPVVRKLEAQGDLVGITFRDHAQTRELTLQRFAGAEAVGLESPRSRPAKLAAIWNRSRALTAWAARFGPDVALSHNSYAQLIAARRAGVPSVTAMDYEHQPANHLGFRLASRVLVPDCFPGRALRRAGAGGRKARRYPGLKEELYLAEFTPDPAILTRLGVRDGGGVAVVRTPPARAVYHRVENRLLMPLLRRLSELGWRSIVLARHPEQVTDLEWASIPGLIVPAQAVDTRSLLCHADLFIGAGGTMTREAALLGTRTFTIFAGRDAAADLELERRGAMRRLTDPAQIDAVKPSRRSAPALEELRERGATICEAFTEVTHAVGEAG